MYKKGKSAIIFGLVAVLALATFAIAVIAHINPQGKQTHPVGLETESCQDALAGAREQLADRGDINPHLLDNIEDKCRVEECTVNAAGVLVCGDCSIEFDAAHEPVLVCGESCVPVSEVDGSCLDAAMEAYESCLNVGGDPKLCRQRMESVLESCGSGGACADISWIQEAGLPQCCTEQALREVICGAEAEWVVGVAAIPTCYIQDS